MGKELAGNIRRRGQFLMKADQALGFSISQMCFAGSEEELKQTANTQPAILTCSVAVHRVLAEKGVTPDFVAGHSLGELFGLGGGGDAEVFRCGCSSAQARAVYAGSSPGGAGRHGSDYGIVPRRRVDACKRAADGEVCSPANLNSPEQTVISGHASAVKRAVEIASQSGAKRAWILAVSAPFHCALIDAGPGASGKGFEGHAVFPIADAAGHECGCGHHTTWR